MRVQAKLVTEGDKLKLRVKELDRRSTDFGGLSRTPAGVHLSETGSDSTLCGLSRREAPSINAALREGKDVCPDCARRQA